MRARSLPTDAIGTVVYEGPNVMLGYAMSRADLDKGDEMNGRLETGDLGRVDAEGFLYLTGRTKRFAKIAGYRLGLDEIEQELFAVCSVACFDLGEKIAVVHEQESETALKARVRELAANYKVPSSSFSLRKIGANPSRCERQDQLRATEGDLCVFDRLLSEPPYSLRQSEKEAILLDGLNELTRHSTTRRARNMRESSTLPGAG